MKSITVIVSALIWIGCSTSKHNVESEVRPQVLIDAEKMAKAFLKRDYVTYAEYTYAGLLEKAGGKEIFIQRIEESIKTTESQGSHHDSVIISDPSKSVMCDGQLQCLLRQETVISNTGHDTLRDITYLIGISSDNGKSWTFLNGARRMIQEVKKQFPNICDSLPLEPKYFSK